ncbi:MAG: cell division protein FtsQ/DivIB [Desulfurivibrionaceae bacterium]
MRKGKPIQQRYGNGRKSRTLDLRKKLAILGVGFLLMVAGFGVVGFIAYKALSRSDFFQITAINIQGCRRTTKNLILEMSGVDVHSNLLALDTKKVKAGIEAQEWVESAEIERDWPNRLSIVIKERLPVAIVSLENGLFYLDQNGIAFAQVLPPEDMDYPVITGLKRDEWPRILKDSQLGEALQFIKYAGQGSSILPKQNISELHVDGDEDITLYLVDRPFPIHLGSGNVGTKYYWLTKVLYKLYKSKEFEKAAYVRMDYGRNQVLVGFDETV